MPLLNMLRSIIHALSGGMLCKESYDIRAHLTLLKGRILEYQELVPERTDIFYEAQEGKVWHTKGWYHKTEDNDEVGPFPTRDDALIALGKYVAALLYDPMQDNQRQLDLQAAYEQGLRYGTDEVATSEGAPAKYVPLPRLPITEAFTLPGRGVSEEIRQGTECTVTDCTNDRIGGPHNNLICQPCLDRINYKCPSCKDGTCTNLQHISNRRTDMERAQEAYDKARIQGKPLVCKDERWVGSNTAKNCGRHLMFVASILQGVCGHCRNDWNENAPCVIPNQ